MGEKLGVAREWISRLENDRGEFSPTLRRQLEHLEQVHLSHIEGKKTTTVEEEPARYPATRMLDRLKSPDKTPASLADVEAYFQELRRAAIESEDPNAWPVIMHRLKQHFPLHEWERREPRKD